ncbi:polysaccharide biosynthesis protein, partial [Candidatus Skiveiella danica]|uniref:polysaccharide biosynthesis protein n=1 Tax=Candidatus Skiveiella danica TaxID=3386177 RepID=UPI0039B8D37A
VTDREMKRYFMTIPEAVSLVLQASILGQGGEVFVLDMGEPVMIVNIAEELIRLHGLEPYKDIDIQFTGLRPGEKLFEEILTRAATRRSSSPATAGNTPWPNWTASWPSFPPRLRIPPMPAMKT